MRNIIRHITDIDGLITSQKVKIDNEPFFAERVPRPLRFRNVKLQKETETKNAPPQPTLFIDQKAGVRVEYYYFTSMR